MATSLADPATAPNAEQASPQEPPGAQPESPGASAPPAAEERVCAHCRSPLDPGQDWCLQCGAGAPGSLGTASGSWHSGATVLAATAILALGAAAAAYAALSKGKAAPRVLTTTVARAPVPVAPSATTPGVPALTPPANLGTPTTVKPALPATPVKPPKIPLTAVTPKTTGTSSQPASGTTTNTSTTSNPATSGGSSASGEPQSNAILLDTNAASTYNPYGYPASDFGDPSLTIDGEPSTGWTAQVEAAVAPKMADGVLLDLKSPRRLAALVLITSTPGMTIQVYGANGPTPPTSITDPAWTKLSPALVEKARHLRLTLRDSKKAFRFVTLWISKAPAASVGTPQAPGHVSVNEIELFPAG